ncbi:MAG: hypothetical protein ACK4J0_00970 [Candidatus Anstonellaceae archaeon]
MKKFFLAFFVLATLTYAFNISDYLYKNEEQDLTVKEFSISDETYKLYYVKNIPILLAFKNSQIINDSNKMKEVLEAYYSSLVLLSGQDKEKFESKIKAFNKSRDLPLSEVSTIRSSYGTESYCLQSLALTSYPCSSQQTCLTTASVVCALFATGGGQGTCDPYALGPMIYDYYSQILILNSELKSISDATSSLSLENAADKYSSILKSLLAIEQASKNINKSRLMVNGGDVGVCYNPQFDYSSLNEAKEIINSYISKLEPVKEVDASIKILKANTDERLAYLEAKGKLELLAPKWEGIKTKYLSLFEEAQNYSSLFLDTEFVDTYKKFSSTWKSIENKFSSHQTALLEDELNLIETLAPKLKSAINKSSQVYLNTAKIKQEVDSKMIYLKYSLSNTDQDKAAYLKLEEKKKSVDKLFSPPMTSESYLKAKDNYLSLNSEIDKVLSSQATPSLPNLASESFGHSTINLLFSFTDSLAILSPSQKKEFAPFIPPLFLILIDVAILSTFSIIFFGIVIKFKPLFKKKNIATIWIVAFLLFLFLILVGSVAFYFTMSSSQKTAKLPEFIAVIEQNPQFYILLSDTSKFSSENLASVRSCSKSIAETVKKNFKKEVYLVETTTSNCQINGKNVDLLECQTLLIGQPVLELKYSSGEKLEFSLVYEKKATYYGSKKDFDSCLLANALIPSKT